MIIRSQNKKMICDFGAGCAISMLGEMEDEGFLVGISTGQDDYDLGYYSTEDEAMRVVGDIYRLSNCGAVTYDMPESVKEEPSKDISLEDVQPELSLRTYNILRRSGYKTLQEVADASDEELLKARGAGKLTLNEIHDIIQKYQEVLNEH